MHQNPSTIREWDHEMLANIWIDQNAQQPSHGYEIPKENIHIVSLRFLENSILRVCLDPSRGTFCRISSFFVPETETVGADFNRTEKILESVDLKKRLV